MNDSNLLLNRDSSPEPTVKLWSLLTLLTKLGPLMTIRVNLELYNSLSCLSEMRVPWCDEKHSGLS